jgi:hypothetical protein
MRHLPVVLLSCFLLSTALAQQALGSAEKVGQVLFSATKEIMIIAPSIRSKAVADAIRRAAVDRGVTIYILADAAFITEPAGYLGGLSRLPKVQVKLMRGIPDNEVKAVIDRQVIVQGPLLVDVSSPLNTKPTTALQSPQKSNNAAARFIQIWQKAKVYRYQIPKPRR